MSSGFETAAVLSVTANESVEQLRGSGASAAKKGDVYETVDLADYASTTLRPPQFGQYETVDALEFQKLNISGSLLAPERPPKEIETAAPELPPKETLAPERPPKEPEHAVVTNKTAKNETQESGTFWKRASLAEIEDVRRSFNEAVEKSNNIRRANEIESTVSDSPFAHAITEQRSGGFSKLMSETEAVRERPSHDRTFTTYTSTGNVASNSHPKSDFENAETRPENVRSNSTPATGAPLSDTQPPRTIFSPMEQLEIEFLEVQKSEALKRLNAREWRQAEDLIGDLLQNPLFQGKERELWIFRRAHVLLILGEWQRLFSLVGKIADDSGRADHCLAEAHYCMGYLEEAEVRCSKAMEKCGRIRAVIKEQTGQEPDDPRWNELMDLMADIMEGSGKNTKAQFFRSKLPQGYVSSIADSRGGDVRNVLRHANRVLDPLKLHCTWQKERFSIQGDSEVILRSFEEAMAQEDETLAWALTRDTSLVDIRSKGVSALHHAAYWGNQKYVDKLISIGADINAKDEFRGWTPLYYTIHWDPDIKRWDKFDLSQRVQQILAMKVACLQNLIVRVSLPVATDDRGFSPMHIAAAESRLDMVKVLYYRTRSSIDVMHDRLHWRPLDIAMMCRNLYVVKYLRDHGATAESEGLNVNYAQLTRDLQVEMEKIYGWRLHTVTLNADLASFFNSIDPSRYEDGYEVDCFGDPFDSPFTIPIFNTVEGNDSSSPSSWYY